MNAASSFMDRLTSMFSSPSAGRSIAMGPYTRSDLAVHPGSAFNRLGRLMFRGNRWMPHQGDKQQARHAGWPDGLMHSAPPRHGESARKQPSPDVHPLDPSSVFVAGTVRPEIADVVTEVTGQMFVGQVVDWTSNGTPKRGTIGHVVPAGKVPAEVGAKVKDANSLRDHESYVVLADGRTYWPRVSLLKLATP